MDRQTVHIMSLRLIQFSFSRLV